MTYGRIETLAEGVTPVERWRRFLADQPCLICAALKVAIIQSQSAPAPFRRNEGE